MKRNRRAGVEDLWFKSVRKDDGTTEKQRSARYGAGSRWRARYVDDDGNEHSKAFGIKAKAQRWLDQQTAAVVSGKHVAPRDAKITVEQWCEQWLDGYKGHRKNSVDGAGTMIRMIVAEFGELALTEVRPSQIKTWCARLKTEGYAQSTISRTHGRLKQILEDAVHDGLLGANPCSRRTSPPAGRKKLYCASTAQIWQLHDAMPERLQVAVLLGAFAGLRISEACGLRVADVDFTRGVVHPKVQWRGAPLKNDASDAPVPIARKTEAATCPVDQRWLAVVLSSKAKGDSKKPYGSSVHDDDDDGSWEVGDDLLQAVHDAAIALGAKCRPLQQATIAKRSPAAVMARARLQKFRFDQAIALSLLESAK